MRLFFSFCFLFLMVLNAPAQNNATIASLLKEAESNLYSQPEQSGKIADYIISQKEDNLTNTEATLLLAKSFFVRGNYNEAAKNALQAKKLADGSSNDTLKLKTKIFAIQLLRELGLNIVAENYLQEIKASAKSISAKFKGEMLQDKAFVNSKANNFSEAISLLNQAKIHFEENKQHFLLNEANIALSEIYLKTSRLDSARIYLQKAQTNSENDYQKVQVLYNFGNLYFSQKAYAKALKAYQQSLDLSLKLPNKIYENKNVERLTVTYLALEDKQQFFSYKQKANTTATEVETDKTLAVNSVYNFTNNYQKELSEKSIVDARFWIYILAGVLLFIFVIGYTINYLYKSKTKEYSAIYKYLSPKEDLAYANSENEKNEKSSLVSEETEQLLLQKLHRFEASQKFTNPDMSIAVLAAQFDTNTKYLSEVINRQKGKNFNSYINELRINYIIEKLKTDSVYFNYKVSYLAEESGFSSHSSFATVFKSVTGISPTKFMDYLQKRNETV